MAEHNNKAMETLNFYFQAMDTWFFRESRPHDAAGASELNSLFPPPIRTLLGAVRSYLGDSINMDWQAFNQGDGEAHDKNGLDFTQAVGDSDGLGRLSVRGAWVAKAGKRLYPVPCYLMQKEGKLARLQIGERVECDLGNVRLPELPKSLEKGYKNLEQSWITGDGMCQLLQGKLPESQDIVSIGQLLQAESRLGIARDNKTRSVIEGQLYQTRHIRIKQDVSIELNINGLDKQLTENLSPKQTEILRLGGEGRMAALSIRPDAESMPFIKTSPQPLTQFIIHFISVADFAGQMFPAGFEPVKNSDQQTAHWQGKLQGIELIIESAVIGKVHREGGWDMKQQKPRSVKSYIPSGSAWFCRLADQTVSSKALIEALHEKCIGEDTQWGRGQILIGKWIDDNQGEKNDSK